MSIDRNVDNNFIDDQPNIHEVLAAGDATDAQEDAQETSIMFGSNAEEQG